MTVAGATKGWVDLIGTSAGFYRRSDLDLDASGNLYVADSWNHMVRKITPAGVVTTIAGVRCGFGTRVGVPLPSSIYFPSAIVVSGTKLLLSTYHGIVSMTKP